MPVTNARAAWAALAMLAICCAGCKKEQDLSAYTDESGGAPASTLRMSDPTAALQLVRGFHGLEQNSWRWTTRNFAVRLVTPEGASAKGATLRLRCSLPESIQSRLHSVTLVCNVNGSPLAAETWSKPGDHEYVREVSGTELAPRWTLVEFSLDRSVPAGVIDTRELGIVVTSVGLEGR